MGICVLGDESENDIAGGGRKVDEALVAGGLFDPSDRFETFKIEGLDADFDCGELRGNPPVIGGAESGLELDGFEFAISALLDVFES